MTKHKSKMQHLKKRFFINDHYKNGLLIGILIIFVVGLILLTCSVYSFESNSFSVDVKLSIKRVIQMLFTGMSLGVASYLLQRMTNNRLADTSIMGFGNFNLIPISILAICTNFSNDSLINNKLSIDQYNYVMPIVVVACSILLCLIFNFLSKDKTKFNFKKLLLSGIILNFVAVAIAFSISSAGDYLAIQKIEQKAVGYIGGGLEDFNFYFDMAIILVALLWIMINSYKIQLIIQNQQIARQTGVYNISIMTQTMICIGLLVGGSYAMSGDFVFVGLIAGNIAFKYSKNKIYYGVPTSGLIGAFMVLITYFIFGNLINVPGNIIAPLIPLIISPYFIYLVIRWR